LILHRLEKKNTLKWKPVFSEIKIRNFNPGTSNKKKIERKKTLKDKIQEELGKSLQKVQKRCKNRLALKYLIG